MKMADGDHCRSIMFYGDPGIDNHRMVPAAHFEQRGDAFVPFFQDDNHNEAEEQAESPTEPIAVNEEPYLPPWPVLPAEHMDEPEEFLLYDFDDTDNSDDISSGFEEDDSSDDSDLEVNNDEDKEAGEESELKQNSFDVGDESILGISQKRDLEQDGQLGGRSNWGFGHDDNPGNLDFQSQATASVHGVECRFKEAEYGTVEGQRNSGSEQDTQKTLPAQGFKRATEEEEKGDEEEDCRYNRHAQDCILENLEPVKTSRTK